MSDSGNFHSSRRKAVDRIRAHNVLPDPEALAAALRTGDRAALSRAITLAESTHPDHRAISNAVIHALMPHTGNAIRIGITGVPGVGKSTFIEAFGVMLAEQGHRIAVLAIDPSSPFTGGSILGDKTRMEKLSVHPNVFIRPTPSSLTPGGVARHTRESIMLCEAAGCDIVLVETVGVGQGEIAVHGMTDFFLLLMLAGAGDQLQGIKRGIMELCDGMLITKADGDNVAASQRAQGDYMSALHLFPPRESGWVPRVIATSAAEHKGIDEAWQMITDHSKWMKERGLFEAQRRQQDVQWFTDSVQGMLFDLLAQDKAWMDAKKKLESEVHAGSRNPFDAADELIQLVRARLH